jgi:hypothetical protein
MHFFDYIQLIKNVQQKQQEETMMHHLHFLSSYELFKNLFFHNFRYI